MHPDQKEKWDRRFLALAKHIASWSKDPSTQVGAVIGDPKYRIVSVGYNGFPQGVEDTPERLNDRTQKYPLIVHGELNALLFAYRSVAGCRLYTWPFQPCGSRCTGPIIQAGIAEVVSLTSNNPRWAEEFRLSRMMFQEAGVKLTLYDSL